MRPDPGFYPVRGDPGGFQQEGSRNFLKAEQSTVASGTPDLLGTEPESEGVLAAGPGPLSPPAHGSEDARKGWRPREGRWGPDLGKAQGRGQSPPSRPTSFAQQAGSSTVAPRLLTHAATSVQGHLPHLPLNSLWEELPRNIQQR